MMQVPPASDAIRSLLAESPRIPFHGQSFSPISTPERFRSSPRFPLQMPIPLPQMPTPSQALPLDSWALANHQVRALRPGDSAPRGHAPKGGEGKGGTGWPFGCKVGRIQVSVWLGHPTPRRAVVRPRFAIAAQTIVTIALSAHPNPIPIHPSIHRVPRFPYH